VGRVGTLPGQGGARGAAAGLPGPALARVRAYGPLWVPLAFHPTQGCPLAVCLFRFAAKPPIPTRHPPRWGVIVLIAETIGLTAVIPYGMMLWLRTAPSGSRGLPVDDGRVVLPPEKRFNVHMLVPCYKVGG
jgi:hypothetical protein